MDSTDDFHSSAMPWHTPLSSDKIDAFALLLGIAPWGSPLHKKYSPLETRLQSFKGWPAEANVTPQSLAEDGFFYTKTKDAVACFQCGLGLQMWETGDIPSIEHANYSPYCVFLVNRKGKKFIDEVQRKLTSDIEKKVPDQWQNSITVHTPTLAQTRKVETTDTIERGICKICYTEEVNIVALPCAHMFACVQCMPCMETCALCRNKVEFTMRVFMS